MRSRFLSESARVCGLAAVYFATAKLALALAIPPGNATPVWPPSGIALGAVLLFGHRVWPGIWLGATLANATTNVSLVTAVSIGVGNTLEALVQASLLRRLVGGGNPFHRGRDVFIFGALAGGLSCAVAATIGVTSLWLGGLMPWTAYAPNWWTWWLGDLGGLIVVTPLVLTWWHEPWIRWSRPQLGEGLALLALVVAISLATFGGWLAGHASHFLPYLVVLFLGWTAFRFGPRETATAITGAVGIAIWGTIRGVGPFRGETLNESLLLLQAFVILVAVTGLTLAALVQEGRTMERSLREARDALGERVQQRTAALRRANDAVRAEITERRRAEEALRQHAERLGILRQIDQAIVTAQTPQAIAQGALRHIRKLIPCSRASAVTFEVDTGEGTLLAVEADSETILDVGVPLEIPGDLRQSQGGKVHVVDDIRQGASLLPGLPGLHRDLLGKGVRSYVNIPLLARGDLVGCLILGSESPGAFSPDQIGIAQEVADSLAVAIHQSRLFRAVSDHREQLRSLAARLAEVEEGERRRLARELHDLVGQSLTGLGFNLVALRDQLSGPPAGRDPGRLDDCLRLVEEIMAEIRNVMAELRPPVLDDYGLEAALRWYTRQFTTRTGVAAEVRGGEPTPRLPPAVETALFRITQEALTNVAKHARATGAVVTLEPAPAGVRLAIADDGMGFDPAALRRSGDQCGWGLIIMRERTAAIGGRLDVESQPGSGTRIVVQVNR